MKAAIVLIILVAAVGYLVVHFTTSSTESFDPTEQGRTARATVDKCTSWTEVLDRVGDPSRWREATCDFDFMYIDRFDETTRDFIAEQLSKNEYPDGFSFFYRYSDAVTFAVNFDRQGTLMNIQDKEGMGDLMDAAGG